jgi:hypothetical protein
MRRMVNGMPAGQLQGVIWQKSGRSGPNGNRADGAAPPTGKDAKRNSRYPAGTSLIYTPDEIEAFILGVRDGDFDNLLS